VTIDQTKAWLNQADTFEERIMRNTPKTTKRSQLFQHMEQPRVTDLEMTMRRRSSNTFDYLATNHRIPRGILVSLLQSTRIDIADLRPAPRTEHSTWEMRRLPTLVAMMEERLRYMDAEAEREQLRMRLQLLEQVEANQQPPPPKKIINHGNLPRKMILDRS